VDNAEGIMIRLELQGGLGNMMFQIAAGLELSNQLNTEFYYTYDWWHCCTPYEVGHYPNTIFKRLNRIYHQDVEKNSSILELYSEEGMLYQPIPKRDNLVIQGSFQSEKFFLNSFDLIKSIFEIPTIDKYKDYTFIHIRRGDYIKFQHIHPIVSETYYKKALDRLESKNVIVLSDDKEWVRNNTYFSQFEISESTNELEDLSIMKSCENAIIANSTFSWWGAWLSNSKKVIAPEPWFANNTPIEIIPDRWIKISI
jgi:hypothetical protein